jgi:hypothetical protein
MSDMLFVSSWLFRFHSRGRHVWYRRPKEASKEIIERVTGSQTEPYILKHSHRSWCTASISRVGVSSGVGDLIAPMDSPVSGTLGMTITGKRLPFGVESFSGVA